MRYQREGYPDEDDIVLCTVKNVQYHSVFVSLDHYGSKQGLIHISEISPGRIRNIRDFVVEGKKILCKVLKVDASKGHIDLSLRRVNESQKRLINDKIKQEQRAENIIDVFSEQHKLNKDETYQTIAKPILQEYAFLHEAFNDVIENSLDLEKYNYKKEFIAPLIKLIKEKITPPEYEHGGIITIKIYTEDGLSSVKEALRCAQIDKKITIKYTGGGTYSIKATSHESKEPEQLIAKAVEECRKYVEGKKGVFDFA